MNDNAISNSILTKISKDKDQLSVVKSESLRLLVEAPAGFGKTFTMVSMIGYWFSANKIPLHKSVLCLSFSISAANRMREDISSFYKNMSIPTSRFPNINATNFHGFCRSVLKKYGFLVGIDDINRLNGISLDKNDDLCFLKIKTLENKIKNNSISSKDLLDEKNIKDYIKDEKKYLISQGNITFDAIIIFTLFLFINFPSILSGYRKSIHAICIDEFQDTNILGISLIRILITPKTKFVAFGDSMQQIFKFQGAIPNLFDILIDCDLDYIKLKTNHRFANNKNMLYMDTALREFSNNPYNVKNINKVELKVLHGKNLFYQSKKISKLIDKISIDDPNATFAILLNQMSKTSKSFLKSFEIEKNFFDATFKSDDTSFVEFQQHSADIYQKTFSNHAITKKEVPHFIQKVENEYIDSINQSFVILLDTFLRESIKKIPNQIRSDYIIESLQNESLRQSIPDVNKKITVSTIHGAKGLEWDYVIIANFQQNEFPNYYDIKSIDISTQSEVLSVNSSNIENIRNLINKLYVAFTRAKIGIYFSYSNEEIYPWKTDINNKISILSSLPFFQIKEK